MSNMVATMWHAMWVLGLVVGGVASGVRKTAAAPTLHFVTVNGTRSTDLETIAASKCSAKYSIQKHSSVSAALASASAGDGLLVLATLLPAVSKDPGANAMSTTVITDGEMVTIQSLKLAVYWEMPRTLLTGKGGVGHERNSAVLPMKQTEWERAVATQVIGPSTPKLSLLHPHKLVDFVDMSSALPVGISPEVVLARVAGFDNASLGLPPTVYPLLTEINTWLLVASTPLSNARTRRFSPTARWQDVTSRILAHVAPQTLVAPAGMWIASVTPSFPSSGALPATAEADAFVRGVDFFADGPLMPTGTAATTMALICTVQGDDDKCAEFARSQPPYDFPPGQGTLGIFEGYTSDISLDGTQPMSLGVRHDCICEVSSSFATRAVFFAKTNATRAAADRKTAKALINFGMIHGGFEQPWVLGGGQQALSQADWTVAGDAFGLMGWEQSDHAFREFYKDDNARALLGGIATAGLLGGSNWHAVLAVNVLANLRATPQNGFGPQASDFANLVGSGGAGTYGWKQIYDSPGEPDYSPHYQSYIWACYLWGYSISAFQPLYDRPAAALRIMMENYPTKWIPTANGIAMQRARMILPLAFLVQVNGSAEHRQWLATIIDGYLELAVCPTNEDWCAFREELGAPGWGGKTRVPTNADYGTFEAPLNQANGDPVSDFLYSVNFAVLGLHEAAAATGNATYTQIEDKLVNYMVRAQARSTEHPALDGAFFRGFDFEKWEAWASDADIGWGAWSVETGWTQSWITTVLGFRQLGTSLWKLGQDVEGSITDDFDSLIETMFEPTPPPKPPPCLPNPTNNSNVTFTLVTALESLCAPAPGSNTSHVIYTGVLCGNKSILWNAMHTMDPRAGTHAGACAWSRAADGSDVPGFFGLCGVPANAVVLPSQVC